MKKFLSLVLALVMAMSLVTISAGATEFKDMADADPAYKEAIDVISELGIVGGVTADTFQPKGTLTRGAATKFIANLMLGPELAAKLPDGAPFTDVAAGSTFAKYASYLKTKGVIGGYGNGSYGVKNPLTGDAFLKMVLGALGYDAAAEGYGVDGWQVNVALDAIEAGLVKGLKKGFDSSKNLTREEAAQIVLNALEAKTVRYETNGSITIGNVVISNNSKAEYVTSTAADYDRAVTEATGDGYQQLVEKLFPDIQKDETATDDFMRPATAWFDTSLESSKQQIVLAVDAPSKVYAINTSSKNTEQKDLYTDLGLTKTTNYTLYTDGAQTATATGTITKTGTTILGNKHGPTMEAYKDGENVVLVLVNEYIAKVNQVNASTGSSDKRDVDLVALTGTSLSGLPTNFETESFAKGDIVTFTVSKKGTPAIKSMELANAKTGELTKTAGSTIYVDGASINVYVPFNRNWSASSLTFGKAVKAYLNSNGHYMYVEMVDDSIKLDKYAYVLAATTITSEADWATGNAADPVHKAQLLYTDGTTEIVEVKTAATDLVNDFVTYGVNAKGQYELEDATSGNITAAGSINVQKGKINPSLNGSTKYVNNATTFIVKTEKTVGEETQAVYTVYVGYKAVPTLTGTGFADVVVKEDATAAAYVFVDATADGFQVKIEDDKDAAIIITKSSTTKYTDANGTWYQLKALVNGEVKSINLAGDSLAALSATYFNYFTEYTVDENGYYVVDAGDRVAYQISSGSSATSKGVKYDDGLLLVQNGSVKYSLAEDATIVYWTSSSAGSVWTVDQLAAYNDAKQNDQYWGIKKDGETNVIQVLYIAKAAD